MKRLSLLAAILTLLIPASAQAEPFTPEVEAYYANAISYWGHNPPQCATISKEVWQGSLGSIAQNYSGGEDLIIGLASQPAPGTSEVNCHITIDGQEEPWIICRVVMHEVGHLEGEGHSGDPTNIMYPYIDTEAYAPGCPAPPSLNFVAPHPIEVLTVTYDHWMREAARCKRLSSHRRAFCFELARALRHEYEIESAKY